MFNVLVSSAFVIKYAQSLNSGAISTLELLQPRALLCGALLKRKEITSPPLGTWPVLLSWPAPIMYLPYGEVVLVSPTTKAVELPSTILHVLLPVGTLFYRTGHYTVHLDRDTTGPA